MSDDSDLGDIRRLQNVINICRKKMQLAETRMVEAAMRVKLLQRQRDEALSFIDRDDAFAVSFADVISDRLAGLETDLQSVSAERERARTDIAIWRMRMEKANDMKTRASAAGRRKLMEIELVDLVAGGIMRKTVSRKL